MSWMLSCPLRPSATVKATSAMSTTTDPCDTRAPGAQHGILATEETRTRKKASSLRPQAGVATHKRVCKRICRALTPPGCTKPWFASLQKHDKHEPGQHAFGQRMPVGTCLEALPAGKCLLPMTLPRRKFWKAFLQQREASRPPC